MGHEWIGSGWLQLLARCALGALLLAAAVSKWRSPDEFEASLMALGVPGRAMRGFATLLPYVEFAVGAALVAGWATRIASFVAAALMATFALAVARARLSAVALRCGPGLNCRARGWTVARNVTLMLIALVPALTGPDAVSADHLLRGAAAPHLAGWEAVPVAGLMLFVVAVAMLLPVLGAAAGRRPAGV